MTKPTRSSAWAALAAQRQSWRGVHVRDLFHADSGRAARYTFAAAGLELDFSKHLIDAATLDRLLALASERDLQRWIERMFAGEPINHTEGRAALHVALRVPVTQARAEVRAVRERMRSFSAGLRSARTITDVVNLGIGGSDLGPRMAVRALRPFASGGPRVHFVANADPADFASVTAALEPASTLFIIASKTFTTVETMSNARLARAWGAREFAAVTANVAAARAFGIAEERIFPMWDWVGGRYSVWSAVGLPLAIAIGMERFEEFLAGAHAMDRHFASAPAASNLPVLLALIGVWNINFWDAQSHAVLPYAEDLRDFPAYLQQLEMESNGKRVDRDGCEVDHATCPVVWGAAGTNGQHAFHQLLHQGTPLVPCDFIIPAKSAPGEDDTAHRLLIANALAQSAALMAGQASAAPHQGFPGNRPSTTLVMERIEPRTLGTLLALYEHKVFTQGVIWNLNSFDQWGVELGKTIARTLLPSLEGSPLPPSLDGSTAALIAKLRQN